MLPWPSLHELAAGACQVLLTAALLLTSVLCSLPAGQKRTTLANHKRYFDMSTDLPGIVLPILCA